MAQANKKWSRGEFCWYELGTSDTAGAKRFYTELFGWSTQEVPMGEMGTYTIAKRKGEDIAGMYKLEGPMFQGVPPHWMPYVAVNDVDADAKKAKSLGGTILQEPMDVPNVGRICFFKDPQGAAIAMFQAGAHPGAGRWEGAPAGMFCWSELMTSDTKAAASFYGGLFGWGTKADKGGPVYTEWQVGGRSVGGMMALTPEHGGMPPAWLTYVAVDDCDDTIRRAGSLGAKTIVPPRDVPNVGRFSVFCDPQGAAIAIIKLG